MNGLFSTSYFPPISYFSFIDKCGSCLIENNEHYIKQSYRNRMNIANANGIMALSVPVQGGTKSNIKDITILNDNDWQKNHWNTLVSAYNHSPFFEFYEDDFAIFFTKKEKYLIDLNEKIRFKIFELLDFDVKCKKTTSFINPKDLIQGNKDTIHNYKEKSSDYTLDFRNSINPKKDTTNFVSKEYYQVFHEKFGFIKNLSILDLIFNCGPEAILYL